MMQRSEEEEELFYWLVPHKQASFLFYNRGFNRDETSGISGEKNQCVRVDNSMTKIYSHLLGFLKSPRQMDAASCPDMMLI